MLFRWPACITVEMGVDFEITRLWILTFFCFLFSFSFMSPFGLLLSLLCINQVSLLQFACYLEILKHRVCAIWLVLGRIYITRYRHGSRRSWNVSCTCPWPRIDPLERRVLFSYWKEQLRFHKLLFCQSLHLFLKVFKNENKGIVFNTRLVCTAW